MNRRAALLSVKPDDELPISRMQPNVKQACLWSSADRLRGANKMFIKCVPGWRDIYQGVDAPPVTNCRCKAVQRFLLGADCKAPCPRRSITGCKIILSCSVLLLLRLVELLLYWFWSRSPNSSTSVTAAAPTAPAVRFGHRLFKAAMFPVSPSDLRQYPIPVPSAPPPPAASTCRLKLGGLRC